MRPIALARGSFFRRLAPFLDDSKRLVLLGDWNAILDPKLDRGGRGTSGSDRCESSLIDWQAEYELVDGFRLDHPVDVVRKFAHWSDSVLSEQSVRRADSDFVTRPTKYGSLRFVNRPSLAGCGNFNTSLLEIGDFRDRLENLIQRAPLGVVTGNKW